MKFVDFFAGIGGMRLGLEQAGHECIGWCEFDKFAQQSYRTIHNTEGEWFANDVSTVRPYDVPEADLWCFGFPCQDISVAGKQAGLEAGKRSGLFFEIMRLLAGRKEEDRPRWLLVENVKNLLSIGGGFDFLRVLLEMEQIGYFAEWQVLNSKDFGVPQNRERVFIVGHLGAGCGREVFPLCPTDGENTCKLQEVTTGQSQGNRVYKTSGLSCTLSSNGGGAGAKTGLYTVPLQQHKFIDLTENRAELTDTARCLQARYNKGYSTRRGECSGVVVAQTPIIIRKDTTKGGEGMNSIHIKEAGIETAGCLVARDYKGVRNGTTAVITEPKIEVVGNINHCGHGIAIKEATKKGYAMAEDGDSVNIGMPDSKTRRGRVGKQIANTLTCANEMGVVNGVRIRRLTPKECWRLQGFPDEYIDKAKATGVSDTQLYKQAGNAVTVNVARAIGEKLKEIEEESK